MTSQTAAPSKTEAVLADAIDEFTERLNRGDRPDIDAFVERYPEAAAALRPTLNVLLALHEPERDGLHGFVDDDGLPAGATGSASVCGTGLANGTRTLGDFRLRREVGRGGMGIVYEAEQISLGRRVALKVLPFAAVLDDRQLARFKNEARAAATLHHTNIVPVFSVGCEQVVHFYAMQFIEGHSLAELVDELRGDASVRNGLRPVPERHGGRSLQQTGETPSPPSETVARCSQSTLHDASASPASTLPPHNSPAYFRAIAQLGIQAAEALEHAHQHGVLHRDIKPANLMLDAAGNLWVTDFGLARLETDTGMTMTGDLVGTLRYMSPEQALGKRVVINHRTDIYSLGVTLYELLTLTAPFDGQDRAAVMRQVAFDEPKPPRYHSRQVPRELETIVLKSIEKNPEDRYAQAQSLADDLRRYLDDKPIAAKPPGLLARARKWTRRHKRSVVTVSCFAALALLGAGIASAMFYRQHAEFTAREQLQGAAEATNEHGLNTIDRAIQLARLRSYTEAENTFHAGFADLAKLQRQYPSDLDFAADRLEALVFYVHFLRQREREDEAAQTVRSLIGQYSRLDLDGAVRRASRVFFKLGECYLYLGQALERDGDYETAAAFFVRGQQCFARLAPDHQDGQAHCLVELGKCRDRQRRWDEARIAYRQALPLLDEWFKTFYTQPNAGAWQWTQYPNLLDARAVQLNVICDLLRAIVCQRLGEDQAARYYLERGADGVYGDDPPNKLALSLLEEAAALLGQAEQVQLDGEPNSDQTFAQSLLRPALNRLRQAEEAHRHGHEQFALTLFGQAIVGAENANLDITDHEVFRHVARQIGPPAANRLSDYKEQRDRRLEGISPSRLPERDGAAWLRSPSAEARVRNLRAIKLFMAGQHIQARSQMQASIALCRKAIENEPHNYIRYVALAWCLLTAPFSDLRDPDEAIRLIEKAQEINPQSSSALAARGAAYYRLGRWADSVNCFNDIPEDAHVHRQWAWRASLFFHAMAHWRGDRR